MPQVLQAGARYLAALDYARRGLPSSPSTTWSADGAPRRSPAPAGSRPAPGWAPTRCPPTGRRRHHRPHPAHLVVAALPDANVGLATGTSFDALIVHGSAGDAARWSVVAQALRSAGPLVRAGGDSWHFLFAPAGLASQRPWGLARAEWRGWGGWVVAPPSHHAGGAVAAWVRDLDTPLPELPPALAERLEQVGPAEPLSQLVYAQARV